VLLLRNVRQGRREWPGQPAQIGLPQPHQAGQLQLEFIWFYAIGGAHKEPLRKCQSGDKPRLADFQLPYSTDLPDVRSIWPSSAAVPRLFPQAAGSSGKYLVNADPEDLPGKIVFSWDSLMREPWRAETGDGEGAVAGDPAPSKCAAGL